MVSCQNVTVVAVGNLTISSTPPGAAIYIYGNTSDSAPGGYGAYGTTSGQTITNIAVNSAVPIKLTLNGYQDYETTVNITSGGTTTLNATFAGSLYITSVLTGASVYIDGNVGASGTTPLTITNFSSGTHHYILKYTGYADTISTAFNITAGQTTTVSNVSFLGSASFTSSPTGARIWIGGADTGLNTPNTVKGLTAGSHGYMLVMTNYANVNGTLTAANDSTVVVSLITMSGVGSINVSSTPSGASVYLDGSVDSLGETPLLITGVLTGSHDVKLTLATYQDYTATGVSVTQGGTVGVSHTMVLSPGSVLFTSTPVGARIWLGPHLGTLVDKGVNTPNTISTLTPGSYDYALVLSDYLTLTGTITISAVTQTDETVTFAGSVSITSSPTGAEIWLAPSPGTPTDQFHTTPTTFTGATDQTADATKTWNYRLVKTGYTDKTGSFLATAGQTATVTETMVTVADIRAQSMIITPSDPCIEGTCSISVSITWINNGESSGTFTPSLLIDGGAIPFSTPYESQSLAGGGVTVTKEFTITGLTAAGSPHGICPNPN